MKKKLNWLMAHEDSSETWWTLNRIYWERDFLLGNDCQSKWENFYSNILLYLVIENLARHNSSKYGEISLD